MIKKTFSIFLILILLLISFTPPIEARGKRLIDLLNELDKLERELKKINEDKNLTQERINQIIKNVENINNDIIKTEKTIEEISKEIEQLNKDILSKDQQIKDLVNFLQLSTGENVYLEYAFGATSLTDFIYRLAIVEQLTKHNDNLIKEMNDMIDTQKRKSEELVVHKENIKRQKERLIAEKFKLGDKINLLVEDALTKTEEIKDARETIKNYQKLGCKPNDYLEECSRVDIDVSFARPLTAGVITSPYSERYHPITGKLHFHYAIDIANSTGTPIFPTANGTVVHIGFSNCGGNYVTIQHLINGEYYASRYMHMNKVYVAVNQKVSKDTQIGTVGGAEAYDLCSTGSHLHFQIAKGMYAQFQSFSPPYTVNPTSIINFPPMGVWFTSRYGKY